MKINKLYLHPTEGGRKVLLPASNKMKNIAQDGMDFYTIIDSDFSFEHIGTGEPQLAVRMYEMSWPGTDRSFEEILGIEASCEDLQVLAEDQITHYATAFVAHMNPDHHPNFSMFFPIRESSELKVARFTYGLYGKDKTTVSKYPLSSRWSGNRIYYLILAEVQEQLVETAVAAIGN